MRAHLRYDVTRRDAESLRKGFNDFAVVLDIYAATHSFEQRMPDARVF
jgi:hypothetical protein